MNEGLATIKRNGIFQTSVGSPATSDDPFVAVGVRAVLQAVQDLQLLCGYGLITSKGQCKPWPSHLRRDGHGQTRKAWMCIGGMRDPNSHRQLRKFFLGGYGQQLCDWVSFDYPAAETFWRIVKREGAK